MKILVTASLLLLNLPLAAAEIVNTCNVGSRLSERIEVVRDLPIATTHIYYVKRHGKREPVFGTAEQSRGSEVLVTCAGSRERALIVSGEFTANAYQGFVLAYPPGATAVERLDFAEKARPRWLYLSSGKIMVVIPTLGYGETNRKYVIYRRIFGKAESESVEATNTLPSSTGFERIELSQLPHGRRK